VTRTNIYTSARDGAIPQHPDDEADKLRRAAWMALYDLWGERASVPGDDGCVELPTDPDVILEETLLALTWLAVQDKKDLAQSLVGVTS
jgi:hypothetical protein